MSGKVFQRVGGLSPRRSVFNLSYDKKFDCDMGQLVPILCEEVVPGDHWTIGNEIVVRFQPLIAPIMHEINVYVHYFFVPYRLLDDDWEEFITGGPDGDSSVSLPRWEPATQDKGTLWDFLGMPTDVDPVGAYPLAYLPRAYLSVWNNYYRDQNLIAESALDGWDELSGTIKNRAWEKDYFTSALPWQQRGVAPSLPISGLTSAVWDDTAFHVQTTAPSAHQSPQYSNVSGDNKGVFYAGTLPAAEIYRNNMKGSLNNNVVDLSSATTFDVADLRLAFQIQKWLERNARGGARYTEFLRSHFGVSPRDDRLQRPEYIGGSKSPVIISEVLQTSETGTSPQGNLAGHGITADKNYCASYNAQEFGVIMGIMSVMPRSAYQQGIDRQWLRETKYDFYFPEFANLSEQAIIRAELYASGVEAENKTVFGYQGRYDEMRVKRSMVCNNMRDTLDYWHLGRQFASAPTLNSTFVTCGSSSTKRIFAVDSEPGLIINFGNIIKAVRPMPIASEPGLIDHN